MSKILISIISMLISSVSLAQISVLNITSDEADSFVRAEFNNTNATVNLYECVSSEECVALGDKDGYLLSDLKERSETLAQQNKKQKFIKAGVASVVFVVTYTVLYKKVSNSPLETWSGVRAAVGGLAGVVGGVLAAGATNFVYSVFATDFLELKADIDKLNVDLSGEAVLNVEVDDVNVFKRNLMDGLI